MITATDLQLIHCWQDSETTIEVTWSDNHKSQFHSIWLRDHCQCEDCVAPGTTQRLLDTSLLPSDLTLRSAGVNADGDLQLSWDPIHESRFKASWLRLNSYSNEDRQSRRIDRTLWNSELSTFPSGDFLDLERDAEMTRWLSLVFDYGFAFLKNVPIETDATEQFAGRIGYIRETNYGRMWDVVTQPSAANLAYTSRELAVHTDNPYRDPVPGMQILHCLAAPPRGGDSVLVDGIAVAEGLRRDHPLWFEILTQCPRRFRYCDQQSDLQRSQPLIQVLGDEIIAVRYNSRSASIVDLPFDVVEDFYRAYQEFGKRLYDERYQIRFRLQPGDLILFDNERILHGRGGFDPNDGLRHLRGCYLDRDTLASKLRVLKRQYALSKLDFEMRP